MPGRGDRITMSVTRRGDEIYAETPVVSLGLGEGWVG